MYCRLWILFLWSVLVRPSASAAGLDECAEAYLRPAVDEVFPSGLEQLACVDASGGGLLPSICDGAPVEPTLADAVDALTDAGGDPCGALFVFSAESHGSLELADHAAGCIEPMMVAAGCPAVMPYEDGYGAGALTTADHRSVVSQIHNYTSGSWAETTSYGPANNLVVFGFEVDAGAAASGVVIYNCEDCRVVQNDIHDAATGCAYIQQSPDLELDGNHIHGCGGDTGGKGLSTCGSVRANLHHNDIYDNVDGWIVQDTWHQHVGGDASCVWHPDLAPMYAPDACTSVCGTDFHHNDVYGQFRVDIGEDPTGGQDGDAIDLKTTHCDPGEEVHIRENWLHDNGGNGILAHMGASDIAVDANRITDNERQGILLRIGKTCDAAFGEFSGSTLGEFGVDWDCDSEPDAYYCRYGAQGMTNWTIRNNQITGGGRAGVHFELYDLYFGLGHSSGSPAASAYPECQGFYESFQDARLVFNTIVGNSQENSDGDSASCDDLNGYPAVEVEWAGQPDVAGWDLAAFGGTPEDDGGVLVPEGASTLTLAPTDDYALTIANNVIDVRDYDYDPGAVACEDGSALGLGRNTPHFELQYFPHSAGTAPGLAAESIYVDGNLMPHDAVVAGDANSPDAADLAGSCSLIEDPAYAPGDSYQLVDAHSGLDGVGDVDTASPNIEGPLGWPTTDLRGRGRANGGSTGSRPDIGAFETLHAVPTTETPCADFGA